MDYHELQEQILEEIKPLRIRGVLKKRKDSVEEFLKKFLSDWNNEKETIYVEDGLQQTDPGRRRSLGDIYRIIRYYYPRHGLKRVVAALRKLVEEEDGFRSSYCHTIHKRVYYFDEDENGGYFDEEEEDEYELVWSDYDETD